MQYFTFSAGVKGDFSDSSLPTGECFDSTKAVVRENCQEVYEENQCNLYPFVSNFYENNCMEKRIIGGAVFFKNMSYASMESVLKNLACTLLKYTVSHSKCKTPEYFFSMQECCFKNFEHALRMSLHKDFIGEDSDSLYETLGIHSLSRGRIGRLSYGENLIMPKEKAFIYSEAEKYSMKDNVIPELDRIYTPKTIKSNILGHPAHYMIETDDEELRKSVSRLLLSALYGNGRMTIQRYEFIDIEPDDVFDDYSIDVLYKSSIGGAVIIRYFDKEVQESDTATYGMDVIEQICKTVKKYRNRVLTFICLPRECTNIKKMFFENLCNLTLVEIKEDFMDAAQSKAYLEKLSKESNMSAKETLLSEIEEDRGYLIPELKEIFNTWFDKELKSEIYPQYKQLESIGIKVKEEPKGSAYDELMGMIGLGEAKKTIVGALEYYKAQKLFADKGMKAENVNMHMVFTGNPGTAKTTVARLFAKIMRDNGLLSIGNLVEVGRADLVGKYVGWTAAIIKEKFQKARGSVLFIDEAYSLVDGHEGSYGDEAINTIVQEMENRRNDVVVIFAGYPDKMEKFLEKNPGLRSRVAFNVHFDDYTADELCSIAEFLAKKQGINLENGALTRLNGIFEDARLQADFGNGRFARNLIEKAKMAQAGRLLSMDYDSVTEKDIKTIKAEDIEIPHTAAHENQTRRVGF